MDRGWPAVAKTKYSNCELRLFTSASSLVVVILEYYMWQIDLLKHGFVSLFHAKCSSTLNHLYFIPVVVLVDVFLGTRRVFARTSECSHKMPIIIHNMRAP